MKTYRSEDELAFMKGIMLILKPKIAVEIGVCEGGSAKVIKEFVNELHLFDTFVGIPSEYAEEGYPAGAYAETIENVKRNIGEAIYYKGDVVKTKFEVQNKKFDFIHIDLDVYIPLKDILPFFYERLNGIMLISNYDDKHPGVIKAIDEFLKPEYKYSRFVFYEKNIQRPF